MEPSCMVHKPWTEQTPDSNVKWEPGPYDQYTGASGGPHAGPTAYIRRVVSNARDLACVFLAMVPMIFFIWVAALANKYAYKDWVVLKTVVDRDGKQKKRKYF